MDRELCTIGNITSVFAHVQTVYVSKYYKHRYSEQRIIDINQVRFESFHMYNQFYKTEKHL